MGYLDNYMSLAGGSIIQVSEYINQLKHKYSSLRKFIVICEINGIKNIES